MLITRETIERSSRIENWFAENIKHVCDVDSTETADRRTAAVSADDAKTMARWLVREEVKHPGEPVLAKEIT
ncbi:hypothetical protein IU468_26985 [Nocardia farcinica]|uniref:hypothetical protein n=1 Tax=Nocardia farcinica TaxID=37329 RepID=UPI00189480B5|nr:hypothetical protein [Nocardia farcinica]MBF6259923.1 hypothetical protein [Nocardia farcinica]MBF6522623.1 hypothetical protein [Nocardia farcinica]